MGKLTKSVTLDDVYKIYRSKGGKLNKSAYRILTDKIFKKVSDLILDGGVWKIGTNLGYICIRGFKKNLKVNYNGDITNGVVNWQASNEIKQYMIDHDIPLYNKETGEGKKWIVYFDDDINYRWAWVKKMGTCTVKNNTAFSFETTNDNSKRKGEECKLGNKGKLKKLLRDNPNQWLKYIYDKNGNSKK